MLKKLLDKAFSLSLVVMASVAYSAQVNNARALFENFQNRLYQIRAIDIASGSKSSIGSAFAIKSNGTLATNYHVISKYVLSPEKYTLEAFSSDEQVLPLSVVGVDVINDLALVKIEQLMAPIDILDIASEEPAKGEQIYSLGNPRDLGMTVVPGTFNGQTTHSYYGRILFSGSINPGMSGGPVLNSDGQVIGVNVATSGNQISFLVPLEKLLSFVENSRQEKLPFNRQAHEQLTGNQQRLMGAILNGEWQKKPLGKANVISEVTDFISCWGASDNDKKDKFTQVNRRCRNSEYIYIAPDFYTGIIEMEFFWYQTKKLTSWQFYRMLNDSFGGAGAGNRASEEYVTEFKCQTDFIQKADKSSIHKSAYCVREYKRFPGLYDVLFLAASVDQATQSLVSHYTISGIEQANAQSFLARFLEQM
ncbi:MAG: serine protease [Kangiellaceae bacterium]|jgi:hypothetical protein|nr:serine protease [Kangiellaceae bacterium]